jgi:hypothetical protein
MRLSPQTGQERVADMPNDGTSSPPSVPSASSQTGQERDADMPDGGTSAPPVFGETTQNRGNEAKNSLKTKCWVKMECAKRTPFCTPEAANEANKVEFRSPAGVAKREIEM